MLILSIAEISFLETELTAKKHDAREPDISDAPDWTMIRPISLFHGSRHLTLLMLRDSLFRVVLDLHDLARKKRESKANFRSQRPPHRRFTFIFREEPLFADSTQPPRLCRTAPKIHCLRAVDKLREWENW